ncbi:alpha/beta fold hydrolase [Celeribacter litoreus]|uniref:alpha/beta fold hydrolase n=1 Tax=Celeribacter litoreus TaxID=2876714 RepID=UPI001CC8EFF1|nr:alpha/beta hydrolase [Celeribacter litoreus]MCA0042494.1 alpha/beta hydrolase [Celeribacter litoreus]
MSAQGRECQWDVDDLHLTGLAWGPEDGVPVLALHGWMDHAESFRELAPRLTGCHVVALDLSGQGLSGHRAAHATYNIWDDLPQIVGLLDLLGWEECVLLGHSRGANIAALLAASLPERVKALISLDSLVSMPTENDIVATLRAFLQQTQKQKSRPPRTFQTHEDYIQRRSGQGNARATAEALAARALESHEGGFRLRGDPRLFASSAVKLTPSDVEAVLKAIQCPVLNIWAKEGMLQTRPDNGVLARLGADLILRYEAIELAGDHHFHLEPQAAEEMAQAIQDFLQRVE